MPRCAWIHDETTLGARDELAMRVPVHDDIRVVGLQQALRRWGSELMSMADMDPHAIDRQLDRFIQPRRARRIRIAEYGSHWCDRRQLLEDPIADIPGVQDLVDARQRIEDLGTHEPVRVRDQTDYPHRLTN